MSSRIRVFAVGLLAIGWAWGVQAQAVASPPHPADWIETYRLENLLESWLPSFFARHRDPTSPDLKSHARSSWKFQAKEGTHLDPNGGIH